MTSSWSANSIKYNIQNLYRLFLFWQRLHANPDIFYMFPYPIISIEIFRNQGLQHMCCWICYSCNGHFCFQHVIYKHTLQNTVYIFFKGYFGYKYILHMLWFTFKYNTYFTKILRSRKNTSSTTRNMGIFLACFGNEYLTIMCFRQYKTVCEYQ